MTTWVREFLSEREKHRFYASLTGEQKMEALQEMVDEAKCLAFLGGAGVSTESGIPDFRSKDGLYHKTQKRFRRYKPEYLLSYDCLSREPKVFFDYYRTNLDARAVQPSLAHEKLAKWEQEGKLAGIVTQNIDGLHQKAGSKKVYEIHGTIMENECVYCRTSFGPDFIFENQEPIPLCPKCGHMVRPKVVLYGEFLPDPAYGEAVKLMNEADCLIIGGTSLEVGSAAGMAHLFHGKHLVIINKGKTKMEGKADLVFHDSIGKVLGSLS